MTIDGFGSFNPTARKARTGRSPWTGEPVKDCSIQRHLFQPGTGFKADLNRKKACTQKAAPAKKAVPARGRSKGARRRGQERGGPWPPERSRPPRAGRASKAAAAETTGRKSVAGRLRHGRWPPAEEVAAAVKVAAQENGSSEGGCQEGRRERL